MGGKKPTRQRLDVALVDRGIAPSRARAQAWVMAGLVDVDGERVDKPGTQVSSSVSIRVRQDRSFVSRGGDKLLGALEDFSNHGLTVEAKRAADIGASTGGFTDCLLQHGAQRVHAVDVGRGLLHEKLRADPRVVVHERINARRLTPAILGERVELVVVDASFIGLGKLLPAVLDVLLPDGEIVALIKPQFEAGRREARQARGVIRDEGLRTQVIGRVLEEIASFGVEAIADSPCRIAGPKGNREHFVYGRGGNR